MLRVLENCCAMVLLTVKQDLRIKFLEYILDEEKKGYVARDQLLYVL